MQNNMQITAKWSRSKPEVEFQHGGRLYFENGNSLSKKNLKQLFCYTFYSQPLTDTFIFSDKSCYCNGTFAIYIAANNECLKKRRITLRYVDALFTPLYYLKFSFKVVDTCKSYAK